MLLSALFVSKLAREAARCLLDADELLLLDVVDAISSATSISAEIVRADSAANSESMRNGSDEAPRTCSTSWDGLELESLAAAEIGVDNADCNEGKGDDSMMEKTDGDEAREGGMRKADMDDSDEC